MAKRIIIKKSESIQELGERLTIFKNKLKADFPDYKHEIEKIKYLPDAIGIRVQRNSISDEFAAKMEKMYSKDILA